MRKPKVLMLGWEFPPVINGGLGIACHGIAKALSKCTDLTVVLPKSDLDYRPIDFKIMGLDRMSVFGPVYANEITRGYAKDYVKNMNEYSKFANLLEVNAGFSPYNLYQGGQDDPSLAILDYLEKIRKGQVKDQNPFDMYFGNFNIGELYGDDVIAKVIEYSYYVTAAASKMDFDVIHGHDWMTVLAGLQLKYATGKPFIYHVHATTYDRSGPEARGWVHDIEKYGMERADAIIPVSNYTAGVVLNHFKIDRNKIFPVHNGIEPVEVFNEEKQFPEKLVLFLGRVTGQKGPEFFLNIAAKVLEKDQNVRFVMAGHGDQLRDLIEKNANKQLGNKFHFTGFLNRDKVNKLLAMTDVYCMPSVSEPFGLSAVEAAQFGIPAVISKQSGVSEVLVNSLMADFWDVNLMAKHICDLISDEDLKKEVVRKTKEDLKNITWDKTAKGIMDVYASLMTEPIAMPSGETRSYESNLVDTKTTSDLKTTTTTNTTYIRNQKFEPKTTVKVISRKVINVERVRHNEGTDLNTIKNNNETHRKVDDLTRIDQIDKPIETLLNNFCIYSFYDMAVTEIHVLKTIINDANLSNMNIDFKNWIEQAKQYGNMN